MDDGEKERKWYSRLILVPEKEQFVRSRLLGGETKTFLLYRAIIGQDFKIFFC